VKESNKQIQSEKAVIFSLNVEVSSYSIYVIPSTLHFLVL